MIQSDDDEVGAVGNFGCGQHPVVAWTVVMRGDGIDKTLEGSECAAFHPQKSVVIKRLLDGKSGLVEH